MDSLNSHLFAETHIVRGQPVRIMSPEGLSSLEGQRVRVHGHTPASKVLGERIYSVLSRGKVVGHTREIELENARLRVDKKELRKHLESPTGAKTRNTFIEGLVSKPSSDALSPLHIRPGVMKDPQTGENLAEGVKRVRLDNFGAGYIR